MWCGCLSFNMASSLPADEVRLLGFQKEMLLANKNSETAFCNQKTFILWFEHGDNLFFFFFPLCDVVSRSSHKGWARKGGAESGSERKTVHFVSTQELNTPLE